MAIAYSDLEATFNNNPLTLKMAYFTSEQPLIPINPLGGYPGRWNYFYTQQYQCQAVGHEWLLGGGHNTEDTAIYLPTVYFEASVPDAANIPNDALPSATWFQNHKSEAFYHFYGIANVVLTEQSPQFVQIRRLSPLPTQSNPIYLGALRIYLDANQLKVEWGEGDNTKILDMASKELAILNMGGGYIIGSYDPYQNGIKQVTSVMYKFYGDGTADSYEWSNEQNTMVFDPADGADLHCKYLAGNFYYLITGSQEIPVAPETPTEDNADNVITDDDMKTIDGSFNNVSDTPAPPSSDPAYGNASAGCLIMYVPTSTEVASFKQALNDTTIWQNFMSSDGIKAIISCALFPFTITGEYVSSGGIYVGGLHLNCDMHMTEDSYRDLDYGTIDCSTIDGWNNFLDYEPYTVYSLHLPFIGKVGIASSDVVGHTLGVKYRVNIATGDFVCFVTSDSIIRGEYYGNVASSIPLSQNDYTNCKKVITGALGLVTAMSVANPVAGAISAGGALAGAGAVGVSLTAGLGATGIIGGVSLASEYCSRDGLKMQGEFSAQTSVLSSREAWLEIETVDNGAYPVGYREICGLPCNASATLGDDNITGFTKVSDIHLDGISATADEKREIEALLKSGVVVI